MMRGLKRTINLMLCMVLAMSLLTGCTPPNRGGETVDTEVSVGEQQEQTNVSEETLGTEGTGTSVTMTEQSGTASDCPEGYVYDYQVSMEPIPEEIAALGGPCQGTIHAYPSKIAMALTELEMEKDPELKEEVEKRIPEIEAALEEEIGGDFVVDGVGIIDELVWTFFCTEVETGYRFDLYYANSEHYAKKNNTTWKGKNVVDSSDYYNNEEVSSTSREELLLMIQEVYSDANIKLYLQSNVNIIDVSIAQFCDYNIDKELEQEKILNLWEKIQEYDDSVEYNISVIFYPQSYRNVIANKYDTSYRFDYSFVYSEEKIMKLMNNGEIVGAYIYDEDSAERNNSEDLNVFLQQQYNGNYNEQVIWENWIQ